MTGLYTPAVPFRYCTTGCYPCYLLQHRSALQSRSRPEPFSRQRVQFYAWPAGQAIHGCAENGGAAPRRDDTRNSRCGCTRPSINKQINRDKMWSRRRGPCATHARCTASGGIAADPAFIMASRMRTTGDRMRCKAHLHKYEPCVPAFVLHARALSRHTEQAQRR